jgi:predicted lipoprotein with Yx(FWY)xxD motif
MINTSHMFFAARMVRLAAAVCTAGLLVGYLAISSFTSRYGASTQMILDSKSSETALSTAVAAQESAGLTCREKPALTDVVLFQRDGEDKVTVLTFDEAMKASSAREGWIRKYCSAP